MTLTFSDLHQIFVTDPGLIKMNDGELLHLLWTDPLASVPLNARKLSQQYHSITKFGVLVPPVAALVDGETFVLISGRYVIHTARQIANTNSIPFDMKIKVVYVPTMSLVYLLIVEYNSGHKLSLKERKAIGIPPTWYESMLRIFF